MDVGYVQGDNGIATNTDCIIENRKENDMGPIYVLIGSGVFIGGYKLGKGMGYIRCGKLALDFMEEVMPGVKESMARSISDGIITEIFEKKKDENEEEEEETQ